MNKSSLFVFLVFWLILSIPMHCIAGNWEQTDNTDGILVYKREVPGSDVLAFRGDGDVDAPLATVATVIFDTSRAPEWAEDLVSSQILKWLSHDTYIEYDHIGTPFVMKDRDFVSQVKLSVVPEKKQMRFDYQSIEDSSAPETGYVRGNLEATTFILTSIADGAKTHLEGEIHCDPKGSVPKWIVNFFQKSWPVDTFKNLRKQVKKPDLRTDPRFLNIFAKGILFP